MSQVTDSYRRVKEEIKDVCRTLGRNPVEITLVGVTKFAPVEAIQEALDAGLTDIGENRVQEGLKKYLNLKASQGILRRHCIGHLQTNKVKEALKVFEIIESVDSDRLALEIEKQAQKLNVKANVLIQINTSGETQKFGTTKDSALKLIEQVSALSNIQILGLMTIAPLTENEAILQQCFADLRLIFEQAQQEFKGNSNCLMQYLSMGMSGDYKLALKEGSNMVRIGRAIFGSVMQQPENIHA